MGRILFFVLLAVAAYVAWRWSRLQRPGGQSGQANQPRPPAAPSGEAEAMVRCSRCGVHLPRSEAIASSGAFYCCDEHRQLGPRA